MELRKQLKIEHACNYAKRCCFAPVSYDGELDGRHDFLKESVVSPPTIWTPSPQRLRGGVENPRTPDFVARLADRLHYAYAVKAQILVAGVGRTDLLALCQE